MSDARMIDQEPALERTIAVKDPEEIRARMGLRIILSTFICLGLLACWYTFLSFRIQNQQLLYLTYIEWMAFAISGLAFTSLLNSRSLKMFFILGIFALALILTSSLVENTGTLNGILILSYSLVLAASVLSGIQSSAAISAGILLAMAASLIDIFSPFKQAQVQTIVLSMMILLAVLVTAIAFLVLRKVVTPSLHVKLVAASFVAVLVPVLAISYFQSGFVSKSIINASNRSLEFGAAQTAEKFDQFFASNRQALARAVKLPAFINYLNTPPADRLGSLAERNVEITAGSLQNSAEPNLLSYGLLDSRGELLFDTDPALTGQDEAAQAYFQSPLSSGQIYISGIEYEPPDAAPVIYFSGPILNAEGKTTGILRARYNARGLQKIAADNIGLIGGRSYPILFDEKAGRVADTLTPDFQLEPGNFSFKPNVTIISATATMKEKPWTVMYVQEQTVLGQLLKQQNQLTVLIATLVAGLVCLLATVLSRSLAQPIATLTQNAEKIAGGNFNITVPVTDRDEIGTLAYAFNLMTDQVRTSINELEDKVRSRTSELETQNRILRNRTRQIQAVAEVARSIASSQDVEKLLNQITSTISERCGFYHVGIFLLDETKAFAELRAANSQGGKKMVARSHKLAVGQVGIVGYVAATGKARIASDVGEDIVHFRNPDLPQTKSEMALPLISSGQIIGVLDVQSEARDAFSQEDVNLFGTLADQVAIAIVNSRLYQEAVRALDESQKLHRQYLRQEWTKLASETPIIGYQYSSTNVIPLYTGTINGEEDIPPHADSNSTVILEENGKRTTVLKIPITLRGEVIGTIDLKDDQGISWDADAVSTAKAVADQISQALENARLFEQTQRRAERERKVLEITGRIRSTTDPETMLQIAASELQNALSARANIVSLRLTEQIQPETTGGNGHHSNDTEDGNG